MISNTINYGYACTRIGVLKRSLMSPESIRNLASSSSSSEVIRMLGETDYAKDLDEMSIKHRGGNLIEMAIGRNIAREFRKIAVMTPYKSRDAIMTLLGKWDVHNIKVILLGKYLGHETDEIKPLLVPAGNLSWDKLNVMLERTSVEDVVDHLLNSEYGGVLSEKMLEYKSSGEVTPLLSALDGYYYASLMTILTDSVPGPAIIMLVKAEIDIKNLMMVLRSKNEGIDGSETQDYLISGGHLPQSMLKELLECKSVEEAVNKIKDEFDLTEELEKYSVDHSIVHFENKLEASLALKKIEKLRYSTMSLEAIVGHIYRKEEEANNIRKIARAKEFNLPEDEIEEMLVFS
ncbi:MAG: ATP synthase A1 subunit C [Methanobacteriota archaeon]